MISNRSSPAKPSSRDGSDTPPRWTPHIDSLNRAIDPVSVLSDIDLQRELSIYANAQFTFDTVPGEALGQEKEDQSTTASLRAQDAFQQAMAVGEAMLHQSAREYAPKSYYPINTSYENPVQIYRDIPMDSYSMQSPVTPGMVVGNELGYPSGHHAQCPPLSISSSTPNTPTFYGSLESPKNGQSEQSIDQFMSMMSSMIPPKPFPDQLSHPTYDTNHFKSNSQGVPLMRTQSHDPRICLNIQTQPSPNTPRVRTKSMVPALETIKSRPNPTPTSSHSTSTKEDMAGPSVTHSMSRTSSTSEQDDERYGSDDENPSHEMSKDDKRRRNTAASARFRVKKKMREQILQRTACEMTEKAKQLEIRVKELEREIGWLKSLVVEKNEGRLDQLMQNRPPHADPIVKRHC
ncbi:hypothetical protein CLU79DRAFT_237239 [Phycomyces nitens]|nr:hypothetical protein CLU79DRAFT_237239 [Phycomyces nitens]